MGGPFFVESKTLNTMTFKDMKTGNPLYTFDRTNGAAEIGKVLSVSAPHFETRGGFNPGVMVVDVAAEISGKTCSYTMRMDTEVAYNNNTAIATSQAAILGEIKAARQAAEQSLAQMDKHREMINKCNSLLLEYDPAAKSKMELENWQNGINKDIADIKQMFGDLLKEWKGGTGNG